MLSHGCHHALHDLEASTIQSPINSQGSDGFTVTRHRRATPSRATSTKPYKLIGFRRAADRPTVGRHKILLTPAGLTLGDLQLILDLFILRQPTPQKNNLFTNRPACVSTNKPFCVSAFLCRPLGLRGCFVAQSGPCFGLGPFPRYPGPAGGPGGPKLNKQTKREADLSCSLP